MLQELKSMFKKQAGVERFDLIQNLSVGLIMNGLTSDFAGFVRNYNMYNTGKTIDELHALFIEYKKSLPKKAATPQVMAIQGSRIQKANKKSLKGKVKGKGKVKDKHGYIPKPKNPKPYAKENLAKDDVCHHCKEQWEQEFTKSQDTSNDQERCTWKQHHTEQAEFFNFNNEGKVDQNVEQCHDIRPLPAKSTDDKTIELSDQSLESENVCLKKNVAQFQKYFGKLEAHCINLELKLQMENNVLKSGQQSQFLKENGNEAKVKNDIDIRPRSSTMTSDHKTVHENIVIQDPSNEQSSSKRFQRCSLSKQDRTSRQELELQSSSQIQMVVVDNRKKRLLGSRSYTQQQLNFTTNLKSKGMIGDEYSGKMPTKFDLTPGTIHNKVFSNDVLVTFEGFEE
ncbi:hypothetical protein Tco_1524591 [Tanacetum coccineum]